MQYATIEIKEDPTKSLGSHVILFVRAEIHERSRQGAYALMEQTVITSFKQPTGLTSASSECLQRYLSASANERYLAFVDMKTLETIRNTYGKEAPTVIAALLVGNPNLIWSANAARPGRVAEPLHQKKYGYTSQFVTEMENRQQSTGITIIQGKWPFMCFEGVLYAMYLGGALRADSILKLFAKSLDTPNYPIRSTLKEWRNFSDLWGVLTGPGPLEYVIPEDISKHNEFLEAGRLLFMGQMSNGQFKDNVPWHVGVTVGNGFFVGMPGMGNNNLQAKDDIAEHATAAKNYAVALGTPLVDLPQRIDKFIAEK
jgi:hypothetical protein